jgi:hypothetical protein
LHELANDGLRLRAVALHSYYDLDHAAAAHSQLGALAVDLRND